MLVIVILLLFSSIARSAQEEICVTPSQQKGYCKSILNCPFLKGLATKPDITKEDIYFLRQSACGFEESIPKVCWPVDDRRPCVSTDAPPDPWSGCCGRAVSERYRKGTSTPAIDQYPWMALIEYEKGNITTLACSAMLISSRYLLSTADCFRNPSLTHIGTPKRVRLGEFNTTNHGPDCIKSQGTLACNDGAIKVPIERSVVHPNYENFIRPICLPLKDITESPPSYFPLHMAGWGKTSDFGPRSEVLQHVGLPFVKVEICNISYITRHHLENSHICAGKPGRGMCTGDTGGPLMYDTGLFTEAIGIVCFGRGLCGSAIPQVYTKVFTYVGWIRKTIELWDLQFPSEVLMTTKEIN